MLVRFSKHSPGVTWIRRGIVWPGTIGQGPSYLWVRSAWRVTMLWLATVGVVVFIGWGLGR